MNLYIAAARPVVDVLLAADPGVDGVPGELPVLYLDLPAPRPVPGLLQGANTGADIPAELPLLYLGVGGQYQY